MLLKTKRLLWVRMVRKGQFSLCLRWTKYERKLYTKILIERKEKAIYHSTRSSGNPPLWSHPSY
jgi:hypothetical protein